VKSAINCPAAVTLMMKAIQGCLSEWDVFHINFPQEVRNLSCLPLEYFPRLSFSFTPDFLTFYLFIMPKLIETVDAEQAKFDATVQEIKEWWATDRQKHIER